MSLAMILMLLNIILEADFKNYWLKLKNNKPFLALVAFYSLYFIGLSYTQDFKLAGELIKTSIPLLLVPTMLCCKPIEDRQIIKKILWFFIASLLVTSLLNFALYQHWVGNVIYDDIRGLSHFGSHVRYGILVSLASGFSLYFSIINKKYRFVFLFLTLWFAFYTFYSQIISGFITLISAIITILFYYLYQWKRWTVLILALFVVLLISAGIYLLIPASVQFVTLEELPKNTALGNPYKHDVDLEAYEDGVPIFTFISEIELEIEWEKVSNMDLHGKDKDGESLMMTLIRYMASKKLTKDSEGFKHLTKDDIQNIEKGIASIKYTRPGILGRIASISYQIQNDYNPNGHSLLQRLHYWKASVNIIKKHPVIGVGTGDANITFDNYYQTENSPLNPELRKRSHNQFLAICVNLGIIGFLVFIYFLTVYFKFNIGRNELLATMTLLVFLASFLIEDTLETQMGVCSFALFIGLFFNEIKPSIVSRNL